MRISRNILANYGGQAFISLVSLLFIPIYIRFMGIESYGLVGVFVSIQVISMVLDLGFSITLNRELARLSRLGQEEQMRDLVRTMEVIYWLIALAIGAVIIALAPFLSTHWFRSDQLSDQTVEQAILLIGLIMVFQWPQSFYSGGMLGLQKQVQLNFILSSGALVRAVGAVLVLWLVSPTIQAFFAWQLVVSGFQTTFTAIFLWRSLPRSSHRPRFRVEVVKEVWKFAAGVGGTSVLSIILSQMDKVVLSALLPLELFGYYTLAGVIAGSLYRFVYPLDGAVFPRFSQLVALASHDEIARLYHRSCQLMSVILLPLGLVMVLFSSEVLWVWSGDMEIARNAHLILTFLTLGVIFNGIGQLPASVQLAHGWTGLRFFLNLLLVVIFVPLMLLATNLYGVMGAAAISMFEYALYALLLVHLMHRRMLQGALWHWYIYDIGLPVLGVLLVVGTARILVTTDMARIPAALFLVVVTAAAFLAGVLLSNGLREQFLARLAQLGRQLAGRWQEMRMNRP